MKEKVRIGIVGTGFAKTVQIPAFQKCEGAEIVSVSSAHIENAERVARDFNIKHFTGDWRETVEIEAVDLVCITTPPVLHKEITLLALKRGKHVLCEKPMAMNAGEAREMLEKSQERNVLALIDHELRFLNGRRKAREMIQSGEIGKIRHVKYNFRAPHRGSSDLPWNWWSDSEAGGGALGAIGSHVFDSLRWFTSAEIRSVFCQLQTHVKERGDQKSGAMREVTTDDEVNLILRFADGELTEDATANISCSMVEYPSYQNRIEIFGTKGAIRVEYDGEFFIGKAGEEDWRKVEIDMNKSVEGARATGWNNGFLAFAAEIIKSLQDDKTLVENAATFEDGYKIQLLMDAARESDKTRAAVNL
ncbi:MAG: Gfo/Idh/MocA family oxidoreductase [Acidobacteriota bacterium]|nr:Gfo/Idh/MocA family oxidoreductase [Acidobacteriota bacterium]